MCLKSAKVIVNIKHEAHDIIISSCYVQCINFVNAVSIGYQDNTVTRSTNTCMFAFHVKHSNPTFTPRHICVMLTANLPAQMITYSLCLWKRHRTQQCRMREGQ